MIVNYPKLFNKINETVCKWAPLLAVGDNTATHDFIESLFKAETITENGYKIRFNELYNTWQTSHPEVGATEEFNILYEAIQYCKNG